MVHKKCKDHGTKNLRQYDVSSKEINMLDWLLAYVVALRTLPWLVNSLNAYVLLLQFFMCHSLKR